MTAEKLRILGNRSVRKAALCTSHCEVAEYNRPAVEAAILIDAFEAAGRREIAAASLGPEN